jgi:D-proline reductase (dithiol) PrdB
MESIRQRYEELGYAPYRWFHADSPPPFTALRKPLAESKLGVVSTSGAYVVGQPAFHYRDDTSVRAIAKNTPQAEIHFSHITENYLENPRKDPNCIVPITALNEAEAAGRIGELAPALFTCMGGIYSQRRVREELIPELVGEFQRQAVDTVLLVPM